MADVPGGSPLAERFDTLTEKEKQPPSLSVLNRWIAHAEGRLGEEAQGGRLGWIVASSVAIAAVQRAIDGDGDPLFLLKGGTLLQHRLDTVARSTKDVDGVVRGDLDAFFVALDTAFAEPWGPLSLRRGPIEEIRVPASIIKPRRFDVILEFRGVTWRRIPFEVSADEAGISDDVDYIRPLPLRGFGLPDPDLLAGIAMRFQIAQKIHAVSDPHDPPRAVNDRARDLVDLLLLRDLVTVTGHPEIPDIRIAAVALFEARARERTELGLADRTWPPRVVAHAHWQRDYESAATAGNVRLPIDVAVTEINSWIGAIDAAQP